MKKFTPRHIRLCILARQQDDHKDESEMAREELADMLDIIQECIDIHPQCSISSLYNKIANFKYKYEIGMTEDEIEEKLKKEYGIED